jgi:hypothetical protein
LSGSEWEYHRFSAFQGTQTQGVIRAILIDPETSAVPRED